MPMPTLLPEHASLADCWADARGCRAAFHHGSIGIGFQRVCPRRGQLTADMDLWRMARLIDIRSTTS
jgi:hypothetical protein